MDECVRLEDVGKQFDGQWVFRHVSLTLPQRQTTAIVGESGCGKTTLLQLINGVVSVDEGVLSVLNAPIPETGLPAFRRKIGYAVQGAGLFPHMTVQQNVDLMARLEGWPESKIRNRVRRLFELMGLDSALGTRYPYQLSGGQQQRVGLCRAMMLEPPLLLLDEPFSALDPLSVETIRNIISDLQKNSITSIISDHNISSTLMSVDRAILLANSIVVAEGRPRDLLSNKIAKQIYFGKEFKI